MTIKSKEINILDQMDRCTKAMKIIQKSPAYKTHTDASVKIRKEFEGAAAERSVPQMIEIERVVLTYSREHDANSPEQVNSLGVALKEINECQRSFSQLANDPGAYKKSAQGDL